MSGMLKEKRSTRGQRMNSLVGDAIDEDNAFYSAEIWEDGDDSDNASFSSEEEKPDEFDSDFNDTEDEGEATEEGDSSKKGKRIAKDLERAEKAREGGRRNVYKEPTRAPKVRNTEGVGSKRPRPLVGSELGPIDRQMRTSTKANTELREKQRQLAEHERKKIPKPRPVVKHTFTQRELLADGLATEESNKRWLLAQRAVIDDKKAKRAHLAQVNARSVRRWLSRRGMNNTYTWTDVDAVPDILKGASAPPVPSREMCIITHGPAKYRDPVTGCHYADLSAFKELRRRLKAGGPLDKPIVSVVKKTSSSSSSSSLSSALPSASTSSAMRVSAPSVQHDPTMYAKHYSYKGGSPRRERGGVGPSPTADGAATEVQGAVLAAAPAQVSTSPASGAAEAGLTVGAMAAAPKAEA